MKCALRSSMLLTLVGVFSFFAVLACLIGNVKDNVERQETIVRKEGAQRAQDERLIQDRAELANQYNTIIESLRQIQKAVESCSR